MLPNVANLSGKQSYQGLPRRSPFRWFKLTTAVRVCLVLSLLVSSPIQIHVISESLEPLLPRDTEARAHTPLLPRAAGDAGGCEGPGSGGGARDAGSAAAAPAPRAVLCLRVALVAATSVVAAAVPDFSDFTDVVGTLFQPVIGFMFPPALFLGVRHLLHCRAAAQRVPPAVSAPWWRHAADPAGAWALVVVTLGVFFIVVGMHGTVTEIEGRGDDDEGAGGAQ